MLWGSQRPYPDQAYDESPVARKQAPSQLPSTSFEVGTLDTQHHLRDLEPGPPTQPPPSGPTDTHPHAVRVAAGG